MSVVITIDGPAGTGKSTVAHRVARRLGFDFLDTGAMYRAAALVALESDIDPGDGPALAEAVRASDLHFDWSTSPPRVMLGGRDVSDRIRDRDVGGIVSVVAAQPALRQLLVEQQRRVILRHPRLVTEGRDQGSVVFPDALVKFYLDADVEVRARRRVAQLAAIGRDVDADDVISGLRERDRIDSSRADGPLTRPDNAVAIDTTEYSLDEVVERFVSEVEEALPTAERGA